MDQITEFCTPEQISMAHIELLAQQRIDNFLDAEVVYMSHDIYLAFSKVMISQMCYTAPVFHSPTLANIKLITSAGELKVKHVSHLTNFCYIGTHTEHDHLEWLRVGAEFEKTFFGDSND